MLLEKLTEKTYKEKIDPTEKAEVSTRYFYTSRDLVRESGLDVKEFDERISELVEIEKLLEMPRDGEFIDELVLIAANEIARDMMGKEREDFYTTIGRKTIMQGIDESNGIFKLVGEVSVKQIYRGTTALNQNFNRVTRMRVAKQYWMKKKIRIERQTKKEQIEKYTRLFGDKGTREILENNCFITKGVLSSAPCTGEGEPAMIYQTACEASGDDSCVYEVTWGKVKDPEQLDIRQRHEKLKRKMRQIEAEKGEHIAKIRKQEAELRRKERELSKNKLELSEKEAKLARQKAENLRQQKEVLEKDAFLGRTARGYAHDLANRLTRVSGDVQILQMYGDRIEKEKKDEYLKNLEQQVMGTVELLQDFREFIKEGRLNYQPRQQGLTHLVNRALNEFRNVCKAQGINIETEYRYEGNISADHYKFPRIIENLVKNATEAMKDKGSKIKIRTYEKEGKACIEIQDDGPGIPKYVQENMFEAGISGKGSSGLGMHIVKTLVELHEGTIEYKTSRDGTKFRIRLPAMDEEGQYVSGEYLPI